MTSLLVSKVEFVRGSDREREQGLLGYVSLRLGESVELNGITLRRTLGGKHTISFPSRRDRRGKGHPIVRVLDDAEREAVEAQVIGVLRGRGVVV